jgi:hypothetical protein
MIKDVVKESFAYGAATSVQAPLSFVLLAVYLRFFGPSEYEIISLFLAGLSLLAVLASADMVSAVHWLCFEAKEAERKRVILTNALLIRVGPDKIREVIQQMFRLIRRAFVLIECH